MSFTYSAPAVNITLKIIESYNIDPKPLLDKLDINLKLIEDPNARFEYSKIDLLWFEAVTIAGDPAFGLRAARYWHPSQMGALGYAWLTSTSLHSALQRLVNNMSLLTEGATLTLEEVEREKISEYSVLLSYKDISKKQATRTDSFMAMLLTMCRANCGEDFKPSAVFLNHSEPDDTTEFHALFQCPVYFNSPENRFNLTKEVANKHLITANPQLVVINDQIMLETLSRLENDNIVAQVKNEILHQLSSGTISDASVARAINISQRSLQRKLQHEKTSFRSILNETKQTLAQKYLQNSSTNLIDIAFNLGFNEYSSFSRAFKQWTGTTPSAYRREQLDNL